MTTEARNVTYELPLCDFCGFGRVMVRLVMRIGRNYGLAHSCGKCRGLHHGEWRSPSLTESSAENLKKILIRHARVVRVRK